MKRIVASDIELLNGIYMFCKTWPFPVVDIKTNASEYNEDKVLGITILVRATFSK